MTIFLVDNSVVQRAGVRGSDVGRRWLELARAGNRIAVCAATLDEACFSARSTTDLRRVRERLLLGSQFLASGPQADELVGMIRTALFEAGTGRAAGVIDVQVAALAVHHQATVLHYDRDFEDIARAFPRLEQRWVAEPGTVD